MGFSLGPNVCVKAKLTLVSFFLLFFAPSPYINLIGEQLTAVSATLSSNYNNEKEFSAANCINGGTSPGGEREICHTANDKYPWLALDFGKTFVVERVEIFNRHDCCGDRTRNVEVHVAEELPTSADQKFSGGSLLGTFPGPGTNGQHIIISGGHFKKKN